MLKIFTTNVVISKGYDGTAALKFSEKGDAVRFRIGKRVYDAKAENNTRWINIAVKAFGNVCERIKKMELKEGSFINFSGRLDEEAWTDKETGEQKSQMVIILDELEYASAGKSKSGSNNEQTPAEPSEPAAPASSSDDQSMPEGFTGYETPFGSSSFFDME